MKYLIKLKPRSKFFFGGDRTFTSQERQNYYSHSTYFPQQTAILGMLRYALLKENKLLDAPQNDKNDLIGLTGFDTMAENYGKILKISPVFIADQTQNWLVAGYDNQAYGKLRLESNTNKLVKDFDYKKWIELLFQSDNGEQKAISTFFKSAAQVGNSKDRGGKAQQDAFFKQNHWTFDRNEHYESKFVFAFEVEMSQELRFSTLNTVFLGAESVFNIEVQPITEGIFERIEKINQSKLKDSSEKLKIVLLSDCFIENLTQLKLDAEFILTDTPVPFKFNENKHSDFYYKPSRSQQYHLLSKGTVIYPKDATRVIQAIEEQKGFRSVGYNHFQLLTR